MTLMTAYIRRTVTLYRNSRNSGIVTTRLRR